MGANDPMIEQKLLELELKLSDRLSKVETEVRVAKHDMANLSTAFGAHAVNMQRMEDVLTSKLEQIAKDLKTVTISHTKGLGFFAGIMAVIGVASGLVLLLLKYVFINGMVAK